MMSSVNEQDFWSHDAVANAIAMQRRSRCSFSTMLRFAAKFRILRRPARAACIYLEGGGLHSETLRAILKSAHDVEVGRYSYGPVLVPGCLPPGSVVGAYCSVASGLTVRRRNHPIERPALHPFFYNSGLGFVQKDTIPSEVENPLKIGNDVWIGNGVTILPGCRIIGNGAVIGAGAVVTGDVQPYSIVGGVPARLIRMRFSEAAIARVEDSKWWTKPMSELLNTIDVQGSPVKTSHFFLNPC